MTAMDHDSKGEPEVDRTIQWARESLQRRRRELLDEKKKISIASRESDETSSPSALTDVRAMLERGRAILAEAEARSEILGRYASPGDGTSGVAGAGVDQSQATTRDHADSTNDSHRHLTADDFMTQFLREGSHDDNQFDSNTCDSGANSRRNAPELPVEMPDWDGENDGQSGQGSDGNDELRELLREGEARARLDELIATVRRQGDDSSKHEEKAETPTKATSSFDPSSLKAARRAALRKVKWDQGVAAAEEEARLLTSFKALPLPGGAEVKHDLFAPTQAFQGKQIGSVEKLVRRDTKRDLLNETSSSISGNGGTFGAFDGISVVTSGSGHDDSFGHYGYENEADRERAKQLREEKKAKKRQLLDAVNRNIMADIRVTMEDDACALYGEGDDMMEDPSNLRQDIARLEAKLQQKKTQRLATLNDIVDIDLNALFDRLLSREAGDDVKDIVDRLKNQVCGTVNDFQYPTIPDMKESAGDMSEPQRKSLFRRQQEWAEQREQKLFDARLQLDAKAMHGITGAPEVYHATQSWKKAKESHGETLKRVAEEEGIRQKEKEAKEKIAKEMEVKEMEELQQQANSRLKSVKSDVNKEEQMKRLQMLSRPRQIREMHINGESDAEVMHDEQPNLTSKSKIFLPATPKRKTNPTGGRRSKSEEKTIKKSNTVSDKKPDEFCGKPSFSEISDKDFAKLVKRISKNASSRVSAQVQVIGNSESFARGEGKYTLL